MSYDCCNKLPQTHRLKQCRLILLTVLEAGSLQWVSPGSNRGVSSTVFLLGVVGEDFFSGLLQLLGAARVPWLLVAPSVFRGRGLAYLPLSLILAQTLLPPSFTYRHPPGPCKVLLPPHSP